MGQPQADQPQPALRTTGARELVASYERVLQCIYAAQRPSGASHDSERDADLGLRGRLSTWWNRTLSALHLVRVPTSHRAQRSWWRVKRLARPCWFVRFFVVDHMRRSLTTIQRRHTAREALGQPDRAEERDAVAKYLESLPTQRRLLYSTTLAVTTVVLTRFVLLRIPGAALQFGARGTSGELDMIGSVLDAVADSIRNIASSGDLLTALTTAPPRTIAFIVASLATMLYLELRWLVPSFRMHRMLCNLDGRGEQVATTPASWSVQRATGVYQRERGLAASLDAPTPRELPFDLGVSALGLPWAMFLAWMLYETGRANRVYADSEALLSFTLCAGVLAVVSLRAAWLLRTWHRRVTGGGASHPPIEVRLPSDRIATINDPIGIFLVALTAAGVFVGIALTGVDSTSPGLAPMGATAPTSALGTARMAILILLVAPIWYHLTRDLAAVSGPEGWRRHVQPATATLAMVAAGLLLTTTDTMYTATAGLLIAWAIASTLVRLFRARNDAGLGQDGWTHPGVVVTAWLAFPLALALVQHALNGLLRAEGTTLDSPGSAVAGRSPLRAHGRHPMHVSGDRRPTHVS